MVTVMIVASDIDGDALIGSIGCQQFRVSQLPERVMCLTESSVGLGIETLEVYNTAGATRSNVAV